MRIAIVNTDYQAFLDAHYADSPGLREASYSVQLAARSESLFSLADFYSRNLLHLGHESWELHANNWWLQRAWAAEHGVSDAKRIPRKPPRRGTGRLLALIRMNASSTGFLAKVLAAQLATAAPDVIINQAVGQVSASLLRRSAPEALIVGQIASHVPDAEAAEHDVMLSSLSPLVSYFRERGHRAFLHSFGFEPSVLSRTPAPARRDIPVSFVGGIGTAHGSRRLLLERLAERVPLQVWGYGAERLTRGSPLQRCHRGPAWGRQAYKLLLRSRITLNDHGVVTAGGKNMTAHSANNVRLFEATGCGALLLTDAKPNLTEYFDVGNEILTYQDPDDAATAVLELLEDDARCASIATAGQQRVLEDHTYAQRMEELVHLLADVTGGRRT